MYFKNCVLVFSPIRCVPVLIGALGEGGPLASPFKRRRYFKEHFQCVGSVEYILDSQKNKTFQYVPILETLQQVLKNKDIAEEIFSRNSNSTQYINK